MTNKITINLLTICTLLFAAAMVACGNSSGSRRSGSCYTAKYENDRNNDGVVDTVYYYTYEIDLNRIKLEIDSDNDGVINEVNSYNLENDPKFLPK